MPSRHTSIVASNRALMLDAWQASRCGSRTILARAAVPVAHELRGAETGDARSGYEPPNVRQATAAQEDQLWQSAHSNSAASFATAIATSRSLVWNVARD